MEGRSGGWSYDADLGDLDVFTDSTPSVARCAACGSVDDLRSEGAWGDVPFCSECLEQTWPTEPDLYYAEIGGSG